MFLKKSKNKKPNVTVLDEPAITAIELCKRAISLSIGSEDFIIETTMEITTEALKDNRLKISVYTKFCHQRKLFHFDFEATMVEASSWALMEGAYSGTATINKKHSFQFKPAGYLKLAFDSTADGIVRSLFRGHYHLT